MVQQERISGFGGLGIKIPIKETFVELEVEYINELIETNFKVDKDGWEIGNPIKHHRGFEVHCTNGHIEMYDFISDITKNLYNNKICGEHPNENTYISTTGNICCVKCFKVIK